MIKTIKLLGGSHSFTSSFRVVMSNSGSTKGFTIKGLENVQENIDFGLSRASHPSAQQLDQNLSRQPGWFLSHKGHHQEDHQEDNKEKQPPAESEPIYVGSLR